MATATPDRPSFDNNHVPSEEEVRAALGSAAGLFDHVNERIAAGGADTSDSSESTKFQPPTVEELVDKLGNPDTDVIGSDKVPDVANMADDDIWAALGHPQ